MNNNVSKELIEALKKNEKPFGLMTDEMRDAVGGIGREHFGYYQYSAGGFKNFEPRGHEKFSAFTGDTTYRLRPDYEMEPIAEQLPEIVECEIDSDDNYISFNHPNGAEMSICSAVNCGDFIGFWYRGLSVMSSSPRLYIITGEEVFTPHVMLQDDNDIFDTDSYEVFTPTHVLFKRSK